MAQNNQTGNPGKMEIELPQEEATGTYANLVMITHSPSEFILDFIAVMPGLPKAKVAKRMILTPDHAKRLAQALNENVERFEKENGPINTRDKVEIPMYRGPQPEA